MYIRFGLGFAIVRKDDDQSWGQQLLYEHVRRVETRILEHE